MGNVLKKFNKLMKESDFQLKIDNFTNDALKKKQIKPRPMQTAIALSAAALVEEKVDCIVKVGTGEGKSLIMSMVTHILLDQEDPEFDFVAVVSPTGVLNSQANALWQPKDSWCRKAINAREGFTTHVKVIYCDVMEFLKLPIASKERTLVIIDEIDAVTKDYMAFMQPVLGKSHLVTALSDYLSDFTVFATSATAGSDVIQSLDVAYSHKPPRVFLDFTGLGMTKPSNDLDEVRVFHYEEGTEEQIQELAHAVEE